MEEQHETNYSSIPNLPDREKRKREKSIYARNQGREAGVKRYALNKGIRKVMTPEELFMAYESVTHDMAGLMLPDSLLLISDDFSSGVDDEGWDVDPQTGELITGGEEGDVNALNFVRKMGGGVMTENMQPGIDVRDVTNFIFRLHMNFMEDYRMFLNILCLPETYAEFKGCSKSWVHSLMRREKLNVVVIDGRSFVLPEFDEVMEFNEFLMRRRLGKEKKTQGNVSKEEASLLRVYEKIYEREVEVEDTVAEWCAENMMHPEGEPEEGVKLSANDMYPVYCAWCSGREFEAGGLRCSLTRSRKTEPVSRQLFSLRMREAGFEKYSTNHRGFYVYFREGEEAEWIRPRRDNKHRLGN